MIRLTLSIGEEWPDVGFRLMLSRPPSTEDLSLITREVTEWSERGIDDGYGGFMHWCSDLDVDDSTVTWTADMGSADSSAFDALQASLDKLEERGVPLVSLEVGDPNLNV